MISTDELRLTPDGTGIANISEMKSELNLHHNGSHDGRRMCPVLLDVHVGGALIELMR